MFLGLVDTPTVRGQARGHGDDTLDDVVADGDLFPAHRLAGCQRADIGHLGKDVLTAHGATSLAMRLVVLVAVCGDGASAGVGSVVRARREAPRRGRAYEA